jgi:hypothetical protein
VRWYLKKNYAELDGLLTVEEAGKLIHACKSVAYELTNMYEANPRTGMPVVFVGRKKFVPKWELLRRFKIVPDPELIKMIVRELEKEQVMEIIEKEC